MHIALRHSCGKAYAILRSVSTSWLNESMHVCLCLCIRGVRDDPWNMFRLTFGLHQPPILSNRVNVAFNIYQEERDSWKADGEILNTSSMCVCLNWTLLNLTLLCLRFKLWNSNSESFIIFQKRCRTVFHYTNPLMNYDFSLDRIFIMRSRCCYSAKVHEFAQQNSFPDRNYLSAFPVHTINE